MVENLRTRFALLLFLWLGMFVSSAQQVRHLSSNDGLINGVINSFERDSLGFVWIGADKGLSRYSGYEFKNYNSEKKGLTSENNVSGIINVQGDLFLIKSNGFLYQYQYDLDRFTKCFSLNYVQFLSIAKLDESKLLIGLTSGFLIYDIVTKEVSKIFHPDINLNRSLLVDNNRIFSATPNGVFELEYQPNSMSLEVKNQFLTDYDVIDIAFDASKRIWIGTEVDGLHVKSSDKIQKVAIPQLDKKTYAIRKISFDKNGKALVAIDRLGLFVFNSQLKLEDVFSHNVDNENSITQNSIYEIYIDEDNAYWLGFREGGINIIVEKKNPFTNIRHVKNESNSISNNNVRSIYETSNDDLWFGTENGVSRKSKNTWTNFNEAPQLFNTAVLAIDEYDEKLLLGTYGEGLLEIHKSTGRVKKSVMQQEKPLNFIFDINVFDENLWIGGIDGPLTHYYNSEFVNSYAVGLVRAVVKGYDEINYIGSSNGLFELNKRNASVRKIANTVFTEQDEIQDLNFDQLNNCIWIASKKGLYKYHLSTEKIERVNEKINQNLGTVFSLQRDNMQNLYLSTITGLWKYNIKAELFRKYDKDDGLQIDEFGFGASEKLKDGSIAFGGAKGAVIFNPIHLTDEKSLSDILLTNFQINGKEPDSLTLPKSINYTKELVLDYDQNSLSFNFETVNFHGSKQSIFQWKLDGYDKEYISGAGGKEITYANLEPGDYTLRVTGFNADGKQGNKSFSWKVEVKKPFWKTWWAISGYILVFCLIIYLITKITQANIQNKFDENKIKFFIEVAHDIRTPVSLIQLLVKQLANQENVETSIELIQRNTQNLNEYVTQLLDFQKIDKKQLKLNVSKVDLKDCLATIANDFKPLMQEKSMDLVLEVKHIPVWFDVPKMNRIFYNMISNAVKYNNEGGEIKIKSYLDDKVLKIDFIDNGIGIPEKQQELIFKRFTRGTNVSNKGIPGTGIGLMLSKKIVELHGGEILLESKENLGSKFTIVLPNGTEHYKDEELVEEIPSDEDTNNVEKLIQKEKLILLVEDNDELRSAIATELSKDFSVIEANNGKEGLLMAMSKNPDLIITDVMMPVMNGKELCKLIKTNFKTSHIPVVMLTAMVGVDDKIQGLEHGADAYVEKPFNVEVLKVTIKNLIKSRENISNLLTTKEETQKQLSPDESFLSDVVGIIKENITEKDFSIDVLCEKMGLSRSNLFRKLKGLIQMSPSDLIIKIKLSRAEELMKEKKISRISDIAYESGFHDPKYFSTLFKKHYGKTPKQFIEDSN